MPRDGDSKELKINNTTNASPLDRFAHLRSNLHRVCIESTRYLDEVLVGLEFIPARYAIARARELGIFTVIESIDTHFRPTGVLHEGVMVTYYHVGRNGILIPTQTFRMSEEQLKQRLRLSP